MPRASATPPTSIPGFNARDLHALVAVAHFGSLVNASAFLQTSQSALSRTITRIERLAGVRLFARSTRRVEPTAAGREFVAVSERVLNNLQITLSGLHDIATEQRGEVIVSSFPIMVQQLLPALVRTFRERRPQVDVHLRGGCNSQVIEDVIGGFADFGLTYGDATPDSLERFDLRRESLHVVLPKDHRLADDTAPIRLAQLRDVPLISPPRDSCIRKLVESAAAAAGIPLRHAVLVPGFPEILVYVRAGVGAGILPSGAMPASLPADVRARLLAAPALSVPVTLIRRAGRHMSPPAFSFWSTVLEKFTTERTSRVAVEARTGDDQVGPTSLAVARRAPVERFDASAVGSRRRAGGA
jgi:DNA-binding transcriptional LysR family regulator